MKRRIKVIHDNGIDEVDAEIVKIEGFYFGLYWNKTQFDDHRIIAVEVTSGRLVSVVYKRRCKAPKMRLMDNIRSLTEAGELEAILRRYEIRAKERINELTEEYEAKIRLLQYPLNRIDI